MEKIYGGDNPKGRSVAILAGIHGDELTPIYTLIRMVYNKMFNLSNISKLTVANILNHSGLKNMKREMVSNNTMDLNRILSIDDGWDSKIENKIEDLIDQHDVIIDIHSSPSCTEFALIDIDGHSNAMKVWCEMAGVKSAFRYSGANTIKRYCFEKGKIGLTLEINQMKKIDFDSAKRSFTIINDLINTVSDVDFNISLPKVKELKEVKVYEEGILLSFYKNGMTFEDGDCLGDIIDFNLKSKCLIFADCKGYVICEPEKDYVVRGDTTFLIQPI